MDEINFIEELKGLSVLYVEDDQFIVAALQRPLSRRVKELRIARDGEEGLAACLQYHPDIVITDIRMPNMDGLQMGRKIRQHFPKLPIVITSAFDDTSFLLESIDIGVNQYVLKPVDLKKLLTSLESAVKELVLEKHIEKKNQALRRHLKMLTEYKQAVELGAVIAKTDPQRVITEVNEAFCKITGYQPAELIGQNYALLSANGENSDYSFSFASALSDKKSVKGLVKHRGKNGQTLYFNLTMIPIINEANEVEEFLDFHEDVTLLINQIYIDPLTGYPNRSALLRDLENISLPLLLLLNIDNFKEINDFYGNEAGDFLLKTITEVLNRHLHTLSFPASVYKLAGDEFAILVKDTQRCPECRIVVESLLGYLESYLFYYHDNEITLSFTGGFTTSAASPFAKADIALRYAKSNHLLFSCYEQLGDMRKIYENNISWTKIIKKAMAEDRIQPWFQPIVDNNSDQIVKYECLMRIIDEGGKVILPESFLKIAYQSRLYPKLAKIMIEKSCAFFQNQSCLFAINMTASEVLNQEMVDFLKQKIIKYGVSGRLIIELVESEDIEKFEVVNYFQREMKALGCQLAIDDFGTGYSNFEHLLKLKVDLIKIDGSIIRHIHEDEHSFLIAQTIAHFAHSLGVKTVAEHVHCAEVLEKTKMLGIDFSQGFFCGQPLPHLL